MTIEAIDMQLQTNIPIIQESKNLIDYQSEIFLLGSCFAEHIGDTLAYYKFKSIVNPFGILFHPLALENLITRALNEEIYTEADIFYLNEQWHCFEAHSRLNDPSKENLINQLNEALKHTSQQLHNATHIILTLGTSWAYRHIESDTIVANCHKVPQKQFLKEILSVNAVSESLQAIISLIRDVNHKASVIFTVSPVRHIKDGFVENNRSKAHLISGIHELVSPRHHVHYFPSYELMMDELRDYRFYNEDMIHPNPVAVKYIWERFKDMWIASRAIPTMNDVETIQKGLLHKPFNENSDQHQAFLSTLEDKKASLSQEFPHIIF